MYGNVKPPPFSAHKRAAQLGDPPTTPLSITHTELPSPNLHLTNPFTVSQMQSRNVCVMAKFNPDLVKDCYSAHKFIPNNHRTPLWEVPDHPSRRLPRQAGVFVVASGMWFELS